MLSSELELPQIRTEELNPRIARMKQRLLTAPYEIDMARARYYSEVYKETEGMNPALRNALGLKKTLENQKIFIYPDESLVGSKTEHFLAQPLSINRGDFLRTLQFELPVIHKKKHPFLISKEDKDYLYKVLLPYWDGKTARDYRARIWEQKGFITPPAKRVKNFLKDLAKGKQAQFNCAYPYADVKPLLEEHLVQAGDLFTQAGIQVIMLVKIAYINGENHSIWK